MKDEKEIQRRIDELGKLRMTLNLVQSEEGARHYKDGDGNRLILYPDGSYNIEVVCK